MSNSSTHWDPRKYSANSDIQFAITMAVLASYRFNRKEVVLDAGCGDGRVSHQLSLRVPRGRVVGIDSSVSMIQFAQTKHGSQANLSFALKDVRELDYMNEFDVAVSTFCLQWVPDKAAAFSGIRRSLRRGVAAILVMPFRNLEIAALTPHLVRLPGEEHQRAFMEELVSRYLAMMPPTNRKTSQVTYVCVCATMIATSG
jgi:trans-aconitate methyltransferase